MDTYLNNYLINPKNQNDYKELEHTEHFNFKELIRAVKFNRNALKKLKRK